VQPQVDDSRSVLHCKLFAWALQKIAAAWLSGAVDLAHCACPRPVLHRNCSSARLDGVAADFEGGGEGSRRRERLGS
jgi:hypothetical protein